MDWFLYDNGLRHERVKHSLHLDQKFVLIYGLFKLYLIAFVVVVAMKKKQILPKNAHARVT